MKEKEKRGTILFCNVGIQLFIEMMSSISERVAGSKCLYGNGNIRRNEFDANTR